MTIANTTVNRHYDDLRALGAALADALNYEVKALAAAGCQHIDQDRLIAVPDCGLGLLGRELSVRKLRNLCLAAGSF